MGSIPRGAHESQGFSTTRWPTSSVVTAGPTSTTSATTSWPNTVGKLKYPLRALSPKSSPKSMKTILASDPQIPVSRVLATAQSSRIGVGFSSSSSRMGVLDNPTRRWLDSSGGVQRSGLTPYKRPCIMFLLRADVRSFSPVVLPNSVLLCLGDVADRSKQADDRG